MQLTLQSSLWQIKLLEKEIKLIYHTLIFIGYLLGKNKKYNAEDLITNSWPHQHVYKQNILASTVYEVKCLENCKN